MGRNRMGRKARDIPTQAPPLRILDGCTQSIAAIVAAESAVEAASRRMQRIRRGACGDREVHDQNISILSEIHEPRISAVLIGTEHDRSVTRFDTIRG
jgi:hypothetical protein